MLRSVRTLCRTILLLSWLAGLSAWAAPAASSISVFKKLHYTSDSTGSYSGDLYQAGDRGTEQPAIVAIHGGSWRSGHKSELGHLCRDLAAAGYTCFSIDYDTHPHSYPISWQEVRAAIAFLRAHAATFHISAAQIAVLGTSAGGQLAALAALAPDGPRTPVPGGTTAAQPEPVEAAVLFNGGYNLHPRHRLLRRYLGGNCDQIPAVCDDASPDDHIHAGAPPIYVGHGTNDHLIPYTQATDFRARLQAAKDPVTPFIAEGAGHSYWRRRHWYRRNLAATESFLAENLSSTAQN